MIAVQIIFLIAVGALLSDADECSCTCNKVDVCEEQNANTAEIQKWSRHYNFVRGWEKDWHNQVTHVVRQQLEVEMNKTLEGLENVFQVGINETLEGLKNSFQKEVSKLKEDLIPRMESLENSVRALHERADELDLTMEMISDQMSGTELHPIQPSCRPACENGGECLRNNVCNCTSLFYGERCQGGPKCGVDFSNGEGSTSSVLVWPWMAAVYKNETYGKRQICGGSVIHRHFVLTSALCLYAHGSDRLSVKLGLSDLKNGTYLREHRVQSIHRHPQYMTRSTHDNRDYGITLLELEEPIPFGPFLRPVCLPPPEIPQDDSFYQPQSIAKAVGRKQEYPWSPLTVINLTILPQEECGRIKKGTSWESNFPSPDLSFCAESSPSTCPRSGSPVVESRVEGGGTRTWTQVGISWCPDKYIFSPRLDHLRAWVDDTIAASSKG